MEGQFAAEILALFLKQSKNILELKLCGNKLGDEGSSVLANILEGPQTSLQKISLAQLDMTHVGFSNLMKAIKSNPALVSIDASENRLDGPLFSQIKQTLYSCKALANLKLAKCNLGSREANYLGQGLSKNTTIRSINLSKNMFTPGSFI